MLDLVGFRSGCYLTSCKMRGSVGNPDLAGGEGPTKARKPLDLCCDYLGDAWQHCWHKRP